MAKGTRYDEQFKKDAVSRYRKGEGAEELAKELGIHYTSIYDWDKKFKNKRGKRRMTKPKSRITITTTTMKVVPIEVVEELKDELAFWKNYALKLIREKESQ